MSLISVVSFKVLNIYLFIFLCVNLVSLFRSGGSMFPGCPVVSVFPEFDSEIK